MLDLEAFTFLNRALESPLSPLVILASNRGNTHIRGGTNLPPSAHGIPTDLLARLLIIPTHPYGPAEIKSIITTRVTTEKLSISEPAKDRVSSLGEKISLRYALQILAPASVLAKVNGRDNDQIQVEDVEECQGLFLDARRSAQALGQTNGYIS
jgi:RuvB-like protein 1 (pontin 52)